jgi:hypothetical protein
VESPATRAHVNACSVCSRRISNVRAIERPSTSVISKSAHAAEARCSPNSIPVLKFVTPLAKPVPTQDSPTASGWCAGPLMSSIFDEATRIA